MKTRSYCLPQSICQSRPFLPPAADVQVQLRAQASRTSALELRQALLFPALLTASGQWITRGVKLECNGEVRAVAFAQSGRTLVTVDSDYDAVRVWDLQEAQPSYKSIQTDYKGPKHRAGYGDEVRTIATHPNGRHVLVGGDRAYSKYTERAFLSVLDLETQQWVAEQEICSGVCSIAMVYGDGSKQLVVTADTGLDMVVWRLDMGDGVNDVPRLWRKHDLPADSVNMVAAVPGTLSVVAGSRYHELWSDLGGAQPSSALLRTSLNTSSSVQSLAVCPQGRLAAACMYVMYDTTADVLVWDLKTLQEVARLNTSHTTAAASSAFPQRCLATSPDGRHLVMGDERGLLLVWDLQTFKRVAAVQVSKAQITCLAFSPGGEVLAAGGQEGLVRLLDWEELLKSGVVGHD